MAQRIIRNRHVENDRWETLAADATDIPDVPVIVPLALWKSRREELVARRHPVGVWLAPEDEPGEIAHDFAHLTIVAVHFPKWGDGRGYSTAALLRRRHGYRGELRAFGDLGRDHLFMLARVGFDSFRLGERHDPQAALAAFNDFSLRYQGSVDDPEPLFRKRAAGARLQ